MIKSCYILSPTGEFDSVSKRMATQKLKFLIKPVLKEFSFIINFPPKEENFKVISHETINQILKSDLVIADISTENPKLFYQLAMVHLASKPVILIQKPGQEMPFDKNDLKIVSFNVNDLYTWEKSKEDLRIHLKDFERNPNSFVFTNVPNSSQKSSPNDIEGQILKIVKEIKTDISNLKGELIPKKTIAEMPLGNDSKIVELSKLFKSKS